MTASILSAGVRSPAEAAADLRRKAARIAPHDWAEAARLTNLADRLIAVTTPRPRTSE